MRILFLSRWYPYPPGNGSKRRILALVEGLARKHEVCLVSFRRSADDVKSSDPLLDLCREVRAVPRREYDSKSLRSVLGFFDQTPRSLAYTYSPEMADAIRQSVRDFDPDLVVTSQIDMSVYSSLYRRVPAILEELEVGVIHDRYENAKQGVGRIRHRLTWLKLGRYLERQLQLHRVVTVVSEREKALLEEASIPSDSIQVIPNFVEFPPRPGKARERLSLIFAGALDYLPNYEAVTWFLTRVFPLVLNAEPGVHLRITGDIGDRILPTYKNVTVTGFVDDIGALVGGSRVSLAPILTGGGTRLKILEAMALGTPVVATSKGAEGLDVIDGKHLFIRDDPGAFATAVVDLLRHKDLWAGVSEGGRDLVRTTYDSRVILPRFMSLVERVFDQNPAIPSVTGSSNRQWAD